MRQVDTPELGYCCSHCGNIAFSFCSFLKSVYFVLFSLCIIHTIPVILTGRF
jgi:hypothetical protein